MAEFLKYGPLGVAALLSVVVLGWNVWKLYDLLGKADADVNRLNAAKPLLYAQIGASMIGFLLVGGGAMWLANKDYDTKQVRTAQLLIDPWDAPDAKQFPVIEVADAARKSDERLFEIECPAGKAVKIEVNLRPYLAFKAEEALKARAALTGPQVSEPDL